jgi:hypothetical protein
MISSFNATHILPDMIDPRLNELYVEAALKVALTPGFVPFGGASEENDYVDNVVVGVEEEIDK